MKVVIIGSRKELEPLDILYAPKTQENAQEKCHNAIKDADEIWFYAKNAGEDTWEDHTFALSQNKRIRMISITSVGGDLPLTLIKKQKSENNEITTKNP